MPKTARELVTLPVVYRVPGMDSITAHASNLKYGDAHDLLTMDLYRPPDTSKVPVVLLIHGSAPVETQPKNWGIFQSWGRLLAASGLAAVTFNHRMMNADVRDALSFARANAGSWNADPERICLAAWSGGGPLLAIDKPDCVKCLVAFYAILDFPVPPIPIFIARAGLDHIPGVNESIDRFVTEALAANAPLTLMNHPEGEHPFDNQNDNPRSHEIIRGAIEFMKEHLGP